MTIYTKKKKKKTKEYIQFIIRTVNERVILAISDRFRIVRVPYANHTKSNE